MSSSSATLDASLCSQLSSCVDQLTTSGKPELDPGVLKQIKKICRLSDDYVDHTYYLLTHQLETDHAEVRLSALHTCDELFQRSHRFRELLVSDFQYFLELTVETDPEEPLPPPAAVAKKLRRTALDIIERWHSTYGEGYKKLALGYNFLKDCKKSLHRKMEPTISGHSFFNLHWQNCKCGGFKVDFRDVHARGVAERQRDEQLTKRKENATKDILERYDQEMSEMIPEINSCLHQMQECFRLLLPGLLQIFSNRDFDDPQPCCSKDLPPAEVEDRIGRVDWVKEHGLVNANYNLTVEVDPGSLKVKVTQDNAILMENLRDLQQAVVSRYLPAVIQWTQAIVKGSGTGDHLKLAIDLNGSLKEAMEKCRELGLGGHEKKIEAPSDDEDDFEEVESKEGYEPTIPQHLRAEYGLEPLAKPSSSLNFVKNDHKLSVSGKNRRRQDELEDPTSMVANTKRIEEDIIRCDLVLPSATSSCSSTNVDERKAKLMAVAPKLRFDADLYNWGEKASEDSSLVIKLDSLHRFWTPFNNETTEFQRKENILSRHDRVTEFSGDFKPVKWQCRAPLPSGRLCPRQDRVKCPFHGPVIPRDVMGNPTDPKDQARLKMEQWQKQRDNPDWQDPVMLEEIKAATGVDLKITKRGKKKSGKPTKKRSYPGLTDLKSSQSTTRSRLEKIVLNRSSVKRVSATLDALDYKKHTDKFANQFNYSYTT